MKLSPLQIARYQYAPKLPGMLRNGISEISVRNGGATESVADQEKIKALFPNTYGKNEIIFEKGQNTSEARKLVVGGIRHAKSRTGFVSEKTCFSSEACASGAAFASAFCEGAALSFPHPVIRAPAHTIAATAESSVNFLLNSIRVPSFCPQYPL